MYRAQENSGNFSDKVESIETSRLDLFVCSFVGAWTAGTSLADPAVLGSLQPVRSSVKTSKNWLSLGGGSEMAVLSWWSSGH